MLPGTAHNEDKNLEIKLNMMPQNNKLNTINRIKCEQIKAQKMCKPGTLCKNTLLVLNTNKYTFIFVVVGKIYFGKIHFGKNTLKALGHSFQKT